MSKYYHTFEVEFSNRKPVIKYSLQAALETYNTYLRIKECLYPSREVYLIDGETGEILMSTDDEIIYG